MAELKYKPVSHEHEASLKKALKRKEFRKAYEELKEEYAFIRATLRARAKCGLKEKKR